MSKALEDMDKFQVMTHVNSFKISEADVRMKKEGILKKVAKEAARRITRDSI